MNRRKGYTPVVFLVVAAWILLTSGMGGAQSPEIEKGIASGSSGTVSDQKKESVVQGTPVYRPPLRGSPGGRVGGGTRGASLDNSVSLSVLAPDHLGITLQSQPPLYWFISKNTTHPVEATIVEKDAVTPLLETRLKPIEAPGIQCIRLEDFGLHLRHNVPYKWFISVVTDPHRRSKDILSGGMIEVMSPSPDLSAKLKQTPKAKQPFLMAEEGIWYDALAGVSERINASPSDISLRKQRAALLNQVGLKEAAEFDLKEAAPAQ